ncbi:MAG TPA: MarR family transcriptional regulator [Candidatus Acidoferrales bacterium]|nr:MarR family transcriptional regulator [Candidatus Acidoferrales bacterium]
MGELFNEIAYTYFPLRAAGDALTARFGQTTAEWGLMRSLDERGPMTVAALARSRPVARQWIQRLANQLTGDGLIEFIDNPDHKRAKLMRLTPAGQRLLRRITAASERWVAGMKSDFDERQIRLTLGLLRRLKQRLRTEFDSLKSTRHQGRTRQVPKGGREALRLRKGEP